MKTQLLNILLGIAMVIGHAQNVTQLEYAIDVDNGVGLNTLVSVSSGNDITASITASIPGNTSIGNHKLYIRTKDENNKWSQTIRRNIQIVATQTQNNVVMGEYLLDTDPAYANAVSFNINPQETDITQAFMAQIAANATIGYHKLYGRVKDTYGNWSHTFRKNIQVVNDEVLNVVAIEYFFGTDPEYGNATTIVLPNPQTDGSWNFNVPYPAGNYDFNDVLYVRAKDNNDLWSITTVLDAVDPNLSVSNFQNNDLVKVFPNPFKNELFIKGSDALVINHLKITNLTGQEVYSTHDNARAINLSTLNAGMYILRLETDKGNASYKIIKH